MTTMNFAKMTETEKMRYDTMYDAAHAAVKSAKLFDGEEPYFELRINKQTKTNAEKIKHILDLCGFVVKDEYECEGSDYPSYCIWFVDKED